MALSLLSSTEAACANFVHQIPADLFPGLSLFFNSFYKKLISLPQKS